MLLSQGTKVGVKMNSKMIQNTIFTTSVILLLCIALLGALTTVSAATGNISTTIDHGSVPTIDGTISAGEWTDATTVTINMAGGQTGTVYFKYSGTTLYVACTQTYHFETFIDINNDGTSLPGTDDWVFHTCGAIYTHQGTGTAWGPQDTSMNGWSTAVNQDSEQAIQFSKIGLSAGTGKTLGVMFCCWDYGDNSDKTWPAGGAANLNNPSNWGQLVSDSWDDVNDPPTVANPVPTLSMDEDATNTDIDLNDVFDDDSTLTFTHNKGGVDKDNIGVSIASGIVTLTPDADWNGQETITFTADDGTNPAVNTDVVVTVNQVNDAPEATLLNLDFTMAEDGTETDKLDLTTMFTDVDTDTNLNAVPQAALTYTYTSSEDIQVTVASNKVSFTPDAHWFGEETFTFTADDGVTTPKTTKDVKVTVTSVKDAPTVENPISDIVMDEDPDEATINSKLIDITTVFADADGDTLTYAVTGNTNIDAKIESGYLRLTPDENYNGMETLTVSASDGTTTKATDEFTVTINPVNDAPVLEAVDDWTVDQDAEKTYQFVAADVDLDTFVYTLSITGLTSTDYTMDTATGAFSFTPGNSLVGTYDAEISVNDQSGTSGGIVTESFEITINNINDAPVATITSPATNSNYEETDKITFVGEATDDDLEIASLGEKITYKWMSDLDGDLGYTAKVNDISLTPGTHSITFTATDKAGYENSATILVIVSAVETTDGTDGTDGGSVTITDTDDDGLDDTWEMTHFGDLSQSGTDDTDGDGVSNADEYTAGSDPNFKQVNSNNNAGTDMIVPVIIIAAIFVVFLLVVIILVVALVVVMKKKNAPVEETKEPEQTEEEDNMERAEDTHNL